jgi:hypothetical protein
MAREIYGGVDAARDQWLAYSGLTVAPWSRDIYSDGWRLRHGGGYGRYAYDSIAPRMNCGTAGLNEIRRCRLGGLTTGSSKIRPPTGPSMSFFNIDP